MTNLDSNSAIEFAKQVADKNIDLNKYYHSFYEQMKKLEHLNYIITQTPFNDAIGQVNELKKEIENEKNILEKKPLLGIPITIKDCIATKNLRTTAGSKILDNYIPAFDATIVKKIKNAGGIIVGKTNMDEFGFGTFSTNSGFKIPKNPYDETRVCGGSSGGACGFAKKINMPHLAIAESTGGSISCPACFCGVFGITPTYGLVSRYGMIDYASSFDKIGTVATNLEDAVVLLNAISGIDDADSTTIKSEKIILKNKNQKAIKDIKIAIPKQYLNCIKDKNILREFEKAKQIFKDKGVKIEEIDLKTTKYAVSCYYIIAMAEASSNLAKYCGLRYGMQKNPEGLYFNKYFEEIRTKYLGEEAKRRSIIGTYIRMAGFRDKYYLKAMQVRTLIINEFKEKFREFDAIFCPTMPIVAPEFSKIKNLSPKQQYSLDILTVGSNLAGFPSINIPFGKINNLPMGVQLIGDHLCEEKIINIAKILNQ